MQKQIQKLFFILAIALVVSGGFFGFRIDRAQAAAGINKQINFQGKVVNTDGTNVSTASYNFLFCIYTTSSPATPCTAGANNDAIWRESKSLTVTDGIFQTNLGDSTSLPGSVDFNTDNIYLGINFNSNGQMSPLVQFTAAPYAFNSDNLDGKDWASPAAIGTTTAAAGTFTSLTATTGGLSVTAGGISISSGALAINNATGITSDQSTMIINANSGAGTVDIQGALNSNSMTVDTGGVSIASGQSYTGAGAVALSSGGTNTGLTLNSSGTGTIAIGNDTDAESINIGTGAGVKTLVVGSLNTTSGVTVQSGSGGIGLQANGTSTGNVQVGDGGAASATPDLLVLDTGSAEPSGSVGAMYYSTALSKFRCYQGSAWTDCIGSGSGGTPAGSNTQVQYNNSGAFGADAGLTFDSSAQTLGLNGTDFEINMTGITNEPSTPATGTLNLYSKSIAGRMMPKWMGPSGLDSIVQPMIAMNKVAWWNSIGNATTAPTVVGAAAMTVVSNGGTALTARNVATTSLFTRMKRVGMVSTATAGTLGSMRQTTAQYTIGNGSGLGGFTYVSRFGSTDTIAGARAFVGMTSSTAAPTNVEPNTLTNVIGICKISTSNNWQICYGGSAAQTTIDLGANFPANTASADMYELILYAPTNVNNSVGYRVTRLGTTYQASGTLTAATPGTQLPASTTLLAHNIWKTNNATASVVGLDMVSIYIELDY